MATASIPALQSPVKATHPLRTRNFVTWWVGATISLLGDQFYIVALPWVVLQITGSGLAMGTVSMAAGIPRAVLMLMGGAITDRSSPRKLLMLTASARTIFVAAIGALLWFHTLQLWHLYVLAFAFGTADAFALPSAGSMLRSLVKPEQLPAAMSVWQSSALLTGVVGPAPAGIIMKTLGVAWAFFLDAISFLFVIAALWMLPDPPQTQPAGPKPSVWKSIGEGLAYMAKQRFSSPAFFGIWLSSVAAGMLVGMLLAGVLKSKHRGRLLLSISVVLGGITGCIGFVPGLWGVAALLAVMGLLSGFINVQFQSWMQQRVDRSVVGRVISVTMVANLGLMPLSMAAAGVAVEWSPQWMFAISGLAVMLVTAFGATQKPVREIA